MKHSEHTHTHSHSHAKDCACDHDHDHNPLKLSHRWLLSILIIAVLLILLRPFIVAQMLVRVTSYSVSSSYNDAIRICKKIIMIDPDNKQAWTSLGYVYMDMAMAQTLPCYSMCATDFYIDKAIRAFERVLLIDPQDKGAASFELGQAHYMEGDFAQAIEYFERVRMVGPRAGALLEADILKYRHGTLGFRSLNSMQTLLGALLECYKQTGNTAKAAEIQEEYGLYKNKHSGILF